MVAILCLEKGQVMFELCMTDSLHHRHWASRLMLRIHAIPCYDLVASQKFHVDQGSNTSRTYANLFYI